MLTIIDDESRKVLAILPELKRHAKRHKGFGKRAILYDDFRKLITRMLAQQNLTTGKNTVDRLCRLFRQDGDARSKWIDGALVRIITHPMVHEREVFDILYFHFCWTNPLFRELLTNTIYPYMIARDQVTRDRVQQDIVEMAGKCAKKTLTNAFHPLTYNEFLVYDRKNLHYDFTFRAIEPLAFLYATYRELERLRLKVLGVHRIDQLLEQDYAKWLMQTRPQIVEIAKALAERKLAGYTFQIEEQLHITGSFQELLERLSRRREGGG